MGGFFAGLAVAWLGEHFGWIWPWSRKATYRLGKTKIASPDLANIKKAISHRDAEGAMDALEKISRQQLVSLNPADCARLATWLAKAGHQAAASSLLRQCLANHPDSPGLDKVYLALGLLRLAQGQPTAAYQHLLSVFDHDPDEETAIEARQALEHIDYYRKTHNS